MHNKYDKQKLLDLMRAEFAFVQRTLDLISAEQMLIPNVQGPWSVKDTIAHLNAWQQRTLRWLQMARRGEGVAGQHPVELEPGFGWDEIDAINAQSYEADKDRPLEEVLAEFKATFDRLYMEAEALPEEELFGKVGLSLFFRDPIWGYIASNTFLHYREHIPPLRQWSDSISKRETIEHRAVKEEE
jgi:hypothetical protein